MEIVRHRIAVIEVVRHDKVTDIHHHLFGPVCEVGIPLYVIVVDAVLYLAGFLGERFEVRAHQLDVNGMVVLPSDRKPVFGICFLEPCTYQFHNLRGVLSLVIAAFPPVFVIHVLGVLLGRGPRIVVFISGGTAGHHCRVLPNFIELSKLNVHLLHDGSVTTLVRVVLQCQTAVLLLQVRQTVYVLKISHKRKFLCPCKAVDKIFLIIKVKTEIAAGCFYVSVPQVIHILQFAQVLKFGIQILLRFCLAATA